MRIPTIEGYAMPKPGTWPPNRTAWTPDPRRCGLLIHDMQHYYLGFFPSGGSPVKEMLANIAELRSRCRALRIPVLYSQAGAQTPAERGLVGDFWGKGMGDGASMTGIVDALAPGDSDIVVRKHRYSAFHRTTLLEEMRNRGRDQLLICGVYAHLGCLVTALDAFMHNIQAFMVSDALADLSEEDHLMALSYAARCCGSVVSSQEVMAALETNGAFTLTD